MTYNFDERINRRGTDCLKVDRIEQQTGRTDLLPLWIADMDFRTPPFVMNAIKQKLSQGILGYTDPHDGYYRSIVDWNRRRHKLTLTPDSIHYLPGVVPGIYFAISAFTDKGDGVLIQPPVYHPFKMTICGTERVCVENPLMEQNGRYEINFEELEELLPSVKIFLFCNPHNPDGRVWTVEEIRRVTELCAKYNVLIVSDEIHADMTLGEASYTSLLSLECPRAIVLLSPSKTFNMPGVVAAHAVVPDEALRHRYFSYLDLNDVACGNIFGFRCTEACYTDEGEEWLNAMLTYVQKNMDYIEAFLREHCPKIHPRLPEASFLVFLDHREMNFASQKELEDFYLNEAFLYLNSGTMFGKEGEGFMRLNTASPHSLLIQAMEQLRAAYEAREQSR